VEITDQAPASRQAPADVINCRFTTFPPSRLQNAGVPDNNGASEEKVTLQLEIKKARGIAAGLVS
jgi:hypothetical protein